MQKIGNLTEFVQQKMPRAKKGRWHLYVLVSPFTEASFYVGVTSDPRNRLYAHLVYARIHPKTARGETLNGILALGGRPRLEVLLTSTNQDELLALESRLVGLRKWFANRKVENFSS